MASEFIVIGVHETTDFADIATRFDLDHYKLFSGGKRHYELVKEHLPAKHEWIDIAGGMNELFVTYATSNNPIVVFASGDPLFYGFANTIKKHLPAARVNVYPTFNSQQLLCHKVTIDYSRLHAVTVHGRTWKELDEALIKGYGLIGILTDPDKNPAAIAKRMLDYNFTNYRMVVGEELESSREQIAELSLNEAVEKDFNPLNVVLLVQKEKAPKYFGIPDHLFSGLENRPNMITKLPVRLMTLSQLNLRNASCLWDIGFCTGSVAIEAKLQFPHLDIVAFEKRKECDQILDSNTKRFSSPGIEKVIGDFFDTILDALPKPDAVFVGGHGNRLDELLETVNLYLKSGGRVVLNAVKDESKEAFTTRMTALKYSIYPPVTLAVDEHNPITILSAEKN